MTSVSQQHACGHRKCACLRQRRLCQPGPSLARGPPLLSGIYRLAEKTGSMTSKPRLGEQVPLDSSQYDPHSLPDFDKDFINSQELQAFSDALTAPTTTPVTALNDWRPIHQKIKKAKRRREPRRTKDETREGWVYSVLYYPFLFVVLGWIIFLVSLDTFIMYPNDTGLQSPQNTEHNTIVTDSRSSSPHTT